MPTTVSTELKKTKEYRNIVYMLIVYLMNVIGIESPGQTWPFVIEFVICRNHVNNVVYYLPKIKEIGIIYSWFQWSNTCSSSSW
jgi:hypothetical protein